MNHFAGIDRYVIVERNEGTRREVQSLRMEKRLRGSGGRRPVLRLAALVSNGTLPLLRRTRPAG